METNHRKQLPAKAFAAFKRRGVLSLFELAGALGIHRNMLRGYANKGVLKFRQKGTGSKRVHRTFRLGDVARFWQRVNRPRRNGRGAQLGRRRSQAKTKRG
jgi:hypothetical protein